jgi:reductive dehalogenase
MKNQMHYSDTLMGKRQLGPYPMEKLKRVDEPTTKITDAVQRFDQREHGFARAARGDFGDLRRTDMSYRMARDPLFPMFESMFMGLPPTDNGTPLPTGLRRRVSGHGFPHRPSDSTSAKHPLLEVSPEKAPIPDDPAVISRNIKSVGYFLGADVMGVCELPEWALYSCMPDGTPVETNHKYAITVAVDQGYRALNGSTGHDWISGSPPQMSYLFSAFISSIVAGYIRRLGYQARVQHYMDYQVLIPPLLLMSGIGEMSRARQVLNPFIGLRFKAAAVTTDLPLEPDKPVDFGLQDFCDKCKKCAHECPSNSISDGGRIMHNGYETWDFDFVSCTKQRVGNRIGLGCGRCINVCPWNKPKGLVHDTVRWSIKRIPLLNRVMIIMDDILGYGKPDVRDRWQFDL